MNGIVRVRACVCAGERKLELKFVNCEQMTKKCIECVNKKRNESNKRKHMVYFLLCRKALIQIAKLIQITKDKNPWELTNISRSIALIKNLIEKKNKHRENELRWRRVAHLWCISVCPKKKRNNLAENEKKNTRAEWNGVSIYVLKMYQVPNHLMKKKIYKKNEMKKKQLMKTERNALYIFGADSCQI